MPRGGARTGAGRKRGIPNKASAAKAAAVAESGLTPLDYLLEIMRDEKGEPHARLDAAKAAAPYVHPRLTAIQHQGDPGKPIIHRIERIIVGSELKERPWPGLEQV